MNPLHLIAAWSPAEMSLPRLLGGTLVLAIYSFVAGWLFAWIYNRLIGP